MFQFRREGTRLVIDLAGHMDTVACDTLGPRVREEIASAREASGGDLHVTFDLADVPYVASAFLRICLGTAKTVGAERVSIVGATDMVRKVFALAGIDTILRVA